MLGFKRIVSMMLDLWVRGADVGLGAAGFLELLHESIASALAKPGVDEALESDAAQRGEGWLNINGAS